MRNVKLGDRLLHDVRGSVLVESTIVIPMFLLLVLGTIDVTYMFYDWAVANKATYVGARLAVVSNPVPSTITSNTNYTSTQLVSSGKSCFDISGTATGNCYSTGVVACTSTQCTPSTYGFSSANFTTILTAMQGIYCPGQLPANCRLKAANVNISYQTNGLGYVAQPGGLPMNITVSLSGLTHRFFFVAGLYSFFGGSISGTPPIPAFATTMQSEDMSTN